MPSKNEIRAYYDGYLNKLENPTTRHGEVFQTINTLNLSKSHVLDIGCGTGITSAYLADKAISVIGIDISPVLIGYAREHNSRPNLEYVCDDVVEWADSTVWTRFDFIAMIDVLEHIPTDHIPALMDSVRWLSHEKTIVYLNIPCYDVLRYLKENQPEILQIVDNPIIDPTSHFRKIGFVPTYFRMYWKQYVEYIFQPEPVLNDLYDNIFKPKIRSNVNG